MRKRINSNRGISMVIIVILAVAFVAVTSAVAILLINNSNSNSGASSTGGKNTNVQLNKVPNGYIAINTVADYENLINGTFDLSKNYILMNNLDLSNYNCRPIGSEEKPFTGVFDGNNYKVLGWSYEMKNETDDAAGFFKVVGSGSVKNLTMENCSIKIPTNNTNIGGVGLLVGIAENIILDNCKINGKIYTDGVAQGQLHDVGLVIGTFDTLVDSLNGVKNPNISDNLKYEEDVVGSHIKNCSATGNINLLTKEYPDNYGGFAGKVEGNTSYYNSGLVLFEYCSSNVEINCERKYEYSGSKVGGFIGATEKGVACYRCYSNGNVNTVNYSTVGGFIGSSDSTYINECFSTGNVSGREKVAGFISETKTFGYTHTYGIKNCYSKGNVKATSDRRGRPGAAFVYYSKDYLNNAYTTGKVTSIAETQAAVSDTEIKTENPLYYNKEELQYNMKYDEYQYVGLTSEQMKQKSAYTTFDFDKVWAIDEGNSTPYLQWAKNILNK